MGEVRGRERVNSPGNKGNRSPPIEEELATRNCPKPCPGMLCLQNRPPPLRHPAPYSSQGLFWCTLVICITGSTVARPLQRHPDKAAASHRPQCPCGSSRFCSPGVSLSFSEVSRLRPAAISIPVPIHPVQGNSAQHI